MEEFDRGHDNKKEKLPEACYYRNLNKNIIQSKDKYIIYPKSLNKGTFISYYLNEKFLNEQQKGVMETKAGWKLHISLSQDDPVNVQRGWDLIVEKLVEYDVAVFKIVAPGVKHFDNKVISIHAYKDSRPSNEWEAILGEITDLLVLNKVYPGQLPNEHIIEGSVYFTHRLDMGEDGEYSEEGIGELNDSPFKDFKVNNQGQFSLTQRASGNNRSSQESEHSSEMNSEKIESQFVEKSVKLSGNSEDSSDPDQGCCPGGS